MLESLHPEVCGSMNMILDKIFSVGEACLLLEAILPHLLVSLLQMMPPDVLSFCSPKGTQSDRAVSIFVWCAGQSLPPPTIALFPISSASRVRWCVGNLAVCFGTGVASYHIVRQSSIPFRPTRWIPNHPKWMIPLRVGPLLFFGVPRFNKRLHKIRNALFDDRLVFIQQIGHVVHRHIKVDFLYTCPVF